MSRAATRPAQDLAEVVLPRGATLLRADSLEEVATLRRDGLWRTPLEIEPIQRGISYTTASARDVICHWAKRGRARDRRSASRPEGSR